MKQCKRLFTNESTYYCLASFMLIFAIVGLIKSNLIGTNALILDDMQLYFASVFGSAHANDLATIYKKFYSYHNKLFFYPPYVRLFYLALLSLCATSTYILINRLIKKPLPSLLIVLVVFLHPTSAIIIFFTNGSYNILFYLLFSTGLIALTEFVLSYTNRKSYAVKVLLYCIGILLICFSLQFTTNGVLLPLSLFFLPWWKCSVIKENKKEFALYGLMAFLAFIISIYFQIIQVGHHPYSKMIGRISYNFVSMLQNFLILCSNIISSYVHPQTETGIPYTTTTTTAAMVMSFAIFSVFIICAILAKTKYTTKEECSNNIGILTFTPFLVALVVLSIGPLTPNVLIHLWHYFLPAIFITLLMLFLIYRFTKPMIFCTTATLIVFVSIFNLMQQMKKYNTSASEQERLISFIKSETPKWKKDCHIAIITNKFPYMSGFGGFGGRDLEYLKYLSGRPDIRLASMVPDKLFNQDHNKFIFENNVPTYLYKFDFSTSVAEKIPYLLVTKGTSVGLYSAGDSGVKKEIDEMPQNEILSRLQKLNISQSEVMNLTSKLKLAEISYTGKHFDFSTKNFLEQSYTISPLQSYVNYEILLNSNNLPCNECSQYNENSPPMPILAHPLAIYQTSNKNYVIQIKNDGGDKHIEFLFDPKKWYKFTFSFDLKKNIMHFFVNDTINTTINEITLDPASMNNAIIGKGYNKRTWQGKIAYFKIHESNGTEKRDLLNLQP